MDEKTIYQMLFDIANDCDIPEELRLAAGELLKEPENPVSIAEQICDIAPDLNAPPKIVKFVMDIYNDGCKKGDPDALYDMGCLYYKGKFIDDIDYGKAVHYFTLAEEKGSMQAAESLGYCYFSGRGVKIDYEKAFRYFLKPALDDSVFSLYRIADMYRDGNYVEKNTDEALRLYEKCLDILEKNGDSNYDRPNVCIRIAEVLMEKGDYTTALSMAQQAEIGFYQKTMDGVEYSGPSMRMARYLQEDIRKKLDKELPVVLE